MQYARADYQTLSRRSAEEKSKAADFAISKFALSLLGTSDILTTALSHVPKPIDPSNTSLLSLYSGVELTHKALLNTFSAHGVKRFERTLGELFDPNLHEATFQVPGEVAPARQDGGRPQSGEVIEVAKEGWMIKDRVLRPAQVGVVQME
jgi:molecular chaperone GrpE